MTFEEDLRACIEAEMAKTGENITSLAKRIGIPPTSLSRFLKKDRSLKTTSIIALVNILGLRLVPQDPASAERAIDERQKSRMRGVVERARRMASDMDSMVWELDSLANFGG